MRALLFSLVTVCSLTAFAERPQFSAFVDSNQLHITIMADQCNHHAPSLAVDSFCDKSRVTRNLAPICKVKLNVASTEAMCRGPLKPKVLTVDLPNTQVDTSNLEVIELTYDGQTIEVAY
jgi:hypothetical protein